MAKGAIDLDRGVSLKQCDKPDCIPVYMYKDDPGVYLNIFGNPVPDEVAKRAGYDVESMSKARALKAHMAEQYEKMRQQLGIVEETDVIEERDGVKIVPFGVGYRLKDAAGNVLTTAPLPLEQAKLLLASLKPKDDKKPAAREKARKEAENE